MSRIRAILLSMSLVMVVLLAQTVSQAQAPGGGGRGGRGGGFGGFGGNRVSSPLRLAMNTYVQEDLKLTDAQKQQIKELSDKADERRRELFPRRGGQGDNGPGNGAAKAEGNTTNRQGRAAAKNGDAPKGNAPNGGATQGRRGATNGNFGNGGNPNFGNGGRPDFTAIRAMTERLDNETELALAKILTKPQRERILQIQLQQEGPLAVTKPAMQKKLNMSPTQIAQIAMVLENRDQARDQLRNAGGEMFAAFRRPDGGFDRDAMRAKMQDPQFKSQMEKMRDTSTKQRERLEDQTIAMIGKTMTKKQHQNFAKMQGKPFDLEKLSRNYDPAAAAAKEKAEAEAAKEEANSKTSSSSKKKSSAKARRSN